MNSTNLYQKCINSANMLHGFPYCTIVLIFLHACITAGNQPHVTSTQNCYYTFVVPRDQDGGSASVSTTAEVIQLRHEVGELKSSVTNLQEQLALLSKLVREGEGNYYYYIMRHNREVANNIFEALICLRYVTRH